LGKGHKKYRALETVAQAIGQSVETLRSWEKAHSFDDDFQMSLRAAQLAGELEHEFDTRPLSEIIKKYATEYFRHSADVEYAKLSLERLRQTPLEVVRAGLKRARGSKKGT
jgi:hypothetical protein